MQSRKVVSSNLEHVAYDELNQELLVIFKSGDAYIYLGVNDLEWATSPRFEYRFGLESCC